MPDGCLLDKGIMLSQEANCNASECCNSCDGGEKGVVFDLG